MTNAERNAYCAGGRNEYADVNTASNMKRKIEGHDRRLVLVEGRLQWQYDYDNVWDFRESKLTEAG